MRRRRCSSLRQSFGTGLLHLALRLRQVIGLTRGELCVADLERRVGLYGFVGSSLFSTQLNFFLHVV
jgi:hypothetical protein